MGGITLPSHRKKHDVGSSIDHEGDIYESLLPANTTNPLTAANPTADQKSVADQILAALKGLDWQESVLDRAAAQPGAPTTGDRYIATATAGDWTINNIYEWDGAAWIETVPNKGTTTVVEDEKLAYTFIVTPSNAWVTLGSVIDHAALNNLLWSVAGHTIDTNIDMDGNKLLNNQHTLTYYVSTDLGSDIIADGSEGNPTKTIQAIIDGTVGIPYIEIIVDASVGRDAIEAVSIPAARSVSIFGTTWGSGVSGHAGINVHLMGDTSVMVGNNLQVNNITGADWANCLLEGCHVVGSISGVKVISSYGSIFDNPAGAKITGYWLNGSVDEWVFSQDINIPNLGDGNKVITENVFKPNTTLAGIIPVDADVTGWRNGCKGMGVGTTGRLFLISQKGDVVTPIIEWIEIKPMTNLTDLETRNHNDLQNIGVDDHHSRYTDSEARTAVQYQIDVNLAGATPVDADVAGWADGDRGQGIGTTGREFYMVKRGTAVKYVEMS